MSGVSNGSTEIAVRWQNVVNKDRNGVILGFKAYYKAVAEFSVDRTEKVEVVNNGSAVVKVIGGLEEYILYSITVLAFTSKGDGPNSSVIITRTDQDGM